MCNVHACSCVKCVCSLRSQVVKMWVCAVAAVFLLSVVEPTEAQGNALERTSQPCCSGCSHLFSISQAGVIMYKQQISSSWSMGLPVSGGQTSCR